MPLSQTKQDLLTQALAAKFAAITPRARVASPLPARFPVPPRMPAPQVYVAPRAVFAPSPARSFIPTATAPTFSSRFGDVAPVSFSGAPQSTVMHPVGCTSCQARKEAISAWIVENPIATSALGIGILLLAVAVLR